MKRVPQRTCIACRAVRPKRSLVRVVRAPEGGVSVDETGKVNGRGAYLCRSRLCWQRALGDRRRRPGGRLAAALNTTLSDQEWDTLWEYSLQLPDAVDSETDASAGQIEGES
jgi:predicted RNA-binding protein YlxR (DUF448 family)